MTKDWVHGVGQSSVCHILLQIVVRAVITPSPPAWTSSAGMLSFPADFPFFNDCSAASTSLRRMGWSSSVSVWRQFSSEKIIAEEQAGFRAGRSTTEQIFNLRILCEKYLQHQQDLYHVFIDFKKVFGRVWHAALWVTMKKYNISTNLIQVIKNLYNKATSAVLFNSSIGDWFRTTVGVRQGCLLSPILFNIFLERIMTDALEDHEGTVNIGGRTITNLRFADDIEGLARDEEELANLV